MSSADCAGRQPAYVSSVCCLCPLCTACKPNGEGNNNSGSNGAGSDCANPGGYDETCCSFTCGNNGVCVAAGTSIGNGNGGHNGGSNGGNNGGGNPKLLGKR